MRLICSEKVEQECPDVDSRIKMLHLLTNSINNFYCLNYVN